MFLSRWGQATGASVVHGVGGSFDILAGITQRAPLWYQKHGLEWLYRVRQEPLRLSRRYLTTNAAFMVMLAREVLACHPARRALLRATAPVPAPEGGLPAAPLPSQVLYVTPGEGP
jgi:Glycosyl transferase WecG/TagA/CpsF family